MRGMATTAYYKYVQEPRQSRQRAIFRLINKKTAYHGGLFTQTTSCTPCSKLEKERGEGELFKQNENSNIIAANCPFCFVLKIEKSIFRPTWQQKKPFLQAGTAYVLLTENCHSHINSFRSVYIFPVARRSSVCLYRIPCWLQANLLQRRDRMALHHLDFYTKY